MPRESNLKDGSYRDIFLKAFYAFTPDFIQENLSFRYSVFFAFFMNGIFLLGLIALSIISVNSLRSSRFLSLEKSSDADCDEVTTSVDGSFYFGADDNGGFWSATVNSFTSHVVFFRKFQALPNEYEFIMLEAYNDYFKFYIVDGSTALSWLIIKALVSSYEIFVENQPISFLPLGDPNYFFSLSRYYQRSSGQLMANNTFVTFRIDSLIYNSVARSLSFYPNYDSPWMD
jgi:hypothetical protein